MNIRLSSPHIPLIFVKDLPSVHPLTHLFIQQVFLEAAQSLGLCQWHYSMELTDPWDGHCHALDRNYSHVDSCVEGFLLSDSVVKKLLLSLSMVWSTDEFILNVLLECGPGWKQQVTGGIPLKCISCLFLGPSCLTFFFCFLSVCQMGAVLCYHALSAMMLCLTMADSQNCGLKPMKLWAHT